MTDKQILIELAKKKIEYANQQRTKQSIQKWTDTNDLKMKKPPVFMKELPWHEIKDDFLISRSIDPLFNRLETKIRQELFVYENFATDNVVEGIIECPLAYYDSGLGMNEDVDIIKTDEASDIVSRHFNVQIRDESDIQKIKDPEIYLLDPINQENMERLTDVFNSVAQVVLTGEKGYWFTPWDNLVRLVGVEELYYDLIDRPEYIHALVERFMQNAMIRMERFKQLGIWASNNDNSSVGSGGAGFSSTLSSKPTPNIGVSPKELWGCGNAQIFSEVSCSMHWEFSLQYELRWLKQFGIVYYGCCEPLHSKFDILEKIPNLRKISMSPWADLDVAKERAGNHYVLSCKPNPAIFAGGFDEQQAVLEINSILNKTKDCNIEVVMKDISTISYNVESLIRWTKLANDLIDKKY